MRYVLPAALACLVLSTAASPPPPSLGTTLTIEVDNVRAARGRVHLDICPENRFLKEGCPYSAEAPAHVGATMVTVHGLPPGRYAVQAFLDENSNGEVDRAIFGVPKEGVGFSNDARIKFSPPKFSDAAFDHGASPQAIRFKLRYFLGPQGPQG